MAAICLLSACAGTDPLVEYEACVAANKVVKTDENGVVQFGKNGEPRWVSKPDTCTAEMERWNAREDAKERRRLERAWGEQCGSGAVLVCRESKKFCMRHPSHCRCSCENQQDVFGQLGVW